MLEAKWLEEVELVIEWVEMIQFRDEPTHENRDNGL